MTKAAAVPHLVRTRHDLRAARSSLPGRVAVVMTLGALHEGHMSLLREARRLADAVIVTIFVNPRQFGKGEDFETYPRTLDADLALIGDLADLVFAPSTEEMYPDEQFVTMDAGRLGSVLEGATRPGHYSGVLTVVGKLLHLVAADVAVFGQKDAQQVVVIRRMVQDLNFNCEIVVAPTVREEDGLALSSRNRYLTPDDRRRAAVLYKALEAGRRAVPPELGGADSLEVITDAARAMIATEPEVRLDYVALFDERDMSIPAPGFSGTAILAIAAWVGGTRLIDNVPVQIP